MVVYWASLIGGLPFLPLQRGFSLFFSEPLGFHALASEQLPLRKQLSFPELLCACFPRPALERKQPEAGGFLKIHCYFLVSGRTGGEQHHCKATADF